MPLFQSRIPTPLSRSNIMCVLHSPLRDPSTIGLGFLAKDINPRNSVGGDFISASQRESHELGSWSLSPLAPSLPTPPTTGKRERRKKERKNKSSHFSHPWTNRGHAGTRDPTCLLPVLVLLRTVVTSAATAVVPAGEYRTVIKQGRTASSWERHGPCVPPRASPFC